MDGNENTNNSYEKGISPSNDRRDLNGSNLPSQYNYVLPPYQVFHENTYNRLKDNSSVSNPFLYCFQLKIRLSSFNFIQIFILYNAISLLVISKLHNNFMKASKFFSFPVN